MDNGFLYKKFEEFKSYFINILPTLMLSIFIFIIFYIVAEYFKKWMLPEKNNNYYEEQNQEQNRRNAINIVYYQLSKITYFLIISLGLIFALVNLGFNIPTIITLLGTVGLALGLAFQETFKNIIASICISLNNLYSIGDVVIFRVLSSLNPIVGKVVDFDLYTTTIIESKTNLLTIIPNNTINNNIISNITKSTT